jgi:hypothetical protein
MRDDIRTLNKRGSEGTHPLEATEGEICQNMEKEGGVSQTCNNAIKISEHRTLTSGGHR